MGLADLFFAFFLAIFGCGGVAHTRFSATLNGMGAVFSSFSIFFDFIGIR